MVYKYLLVLIVIISSTSPGIAQVYNAEACHHTSGECYAATADLTYNMVTIELSNNNLLELELDTSHPEDLTAYDETSNVYYDIELLE